ncbi:probable cellulose 1,4-beta-cellobiosidase II precursor [Serendipita indica DSM 11827]|uniref:Glucanase n=1 Tax=Serendipita indica (strain DSM 11827) TaxID=1109443 RepID=G4T5S8_SERID|nr:probable cellulose 1,4-beta-cellobiosidase II precursor [Serendipita indica DSM 11827]
MKHFHSLLAFVTAVCTLVSASPTPPGPPGPPSPPTPPGSSITTSNPFTGHDFFVSPVYRKEAGEAAVTLLKQGKFDLANRASYVAAKIGTFLWVSDTATVPKIGDWLKEAALVQSLTGKKQVVEIEVYNLPDRDCSAAASAGELSYANDGEKKYQDYIKAVAAQIKKFPQLRVVIGLETDSIGNLVTNLSVPKCAAAADGQKRSLAYAIANLQLPNVAIYVDGAHAGWLGWPSNIGPTADIIAEIVAAAKKLNPKAGIRGVATNVSNYNGFGNQPQTGYDELVYVKNLQPLLAAKGIDAHFIVDQGRSGNQNSTRVGGDWCNNKYAGFGPLPTTNTGEAIVDALVWVKPGGEADGTSDPTAPRYDTTCGNEYALQPAPEAGTWFQAYFEQLLRNANPKIPRLI